MPVLPGGAQDRPGNTRGDCAHGAREAAPHRGSGGGSAKAEGRRRAARAAFPEKLRSREIAREGTRKEIRRTLQSRQRDHRPGAATAEYPFELAESSQNDGPPMNTDKRGLKRIFFYRRSSAFIGGSN